MSSEGANRGYAAAPLKESKVTISEVVAFGNFFKQILDSTSLKWWIIAAGFGAIIEALHVFWLAGVWLYWFAKTH